MKSKIVGAVLVALLATVSAGCRDPKPGPSLNKPKRTEAPEYDCVKHAKDGICEVPVNGKVVLYCTRGLNRIVHYREECK